MQEARAATSLLGVPNTQQFFLGYPDGGVTHLLADNRSAPYPAKFTGDTHVPYQDAVFPNHPYTGESLEHDFDAILDRVNPTLILAPSPADTHPDHRATGLLTIEALTRRNELPKAYYWIVHGGEGWPSPRTYMPSIPLNLPPAGKQLPWKAFVLTDEEVARKLRAVSAYETQMRVMSPFLLTFVRTSELYSAVRAPSAAATDPTCDPTHRRSAPAADRATPAAASSCD
jgi:LmbE family N-acetylglucosaminyl deacetylase